MYGDKAANIPDWLPDDPTSDEASQMVLNQSETLDQAQITSYMSGYFDGEGCILFSVHKNKCSKHNYKVQPRIQVKAAQMAGLFDAEGSIQLDVSNHHSNSLNHSLGPHLRLGQVQDKTMVKDIFNSYQEYFDFNYSLTRRELDPPLQPQVRARICRRNDIKNFLAPLLPMLKEKQEQAIIMLREIIPRLDLRIWETIPKSSGYKSSIAN